jgi:hypothetical protein
MKKEKELMFSDVHDYKIHPILGYKWKQPTINPHAKTKPHELDSY